MANQYRRKLDKIYGKVDKIAIVGRDNLLEYQKYIDELIEKGDYSIFQEMLYIYYNIDIINIQSVDEVKKSTYNEIIFQTKNSFLSKLSKIYKQKGVFQQSFNIYLDSNSQTIGSINEIDANSENFKYLLKNKMYARLIGESKTYLEVKRENSIESIFIEDENTDWSEEQNLLNRYRIAIDYLLEIN
jgi:hypothetical protein